MFKLHLMNSDTSIYQRTTDTIIFISSRSNTLALSALVDVTVSSKKHKLAKLNERKEFSLPLQ